tara:strand:+ start:189 stop:425 length:237 start_codon:yes stop_codon:yes gene_type:complete
MKNTKKTIISESTFNWLLKILLGKDNAIKLKYFAAIKTNPKLFKLSKELEKTAAEMEQQMKRTHGGLDPSDLKRMRGN